MFVESEALFVVVLPELELELIHAHMAQKPPQGLCNAPHDSGMCWKQFMMCLEETWFVAAFHSTPMHDLGAEGGPTSSSGLRVEGCQCTTLPPQLLLASKTARRSAISAARCATSRRLSSGVTLVSPRGCRTKGLPMAKGGVVTSLCHPARSCARCAHSVNTVGRLAAVT